MMLELNSEYRYICESFPGYIDKLEKFSREVYTKHRYSLGVKLNDSPYYDALIFWFIKDGKNLEVGQVDILLQNLLTQFKTELDKTCKHCGSDFNIKFQICEVCLANERREEYRLSTSAFAYFSRSSFFQSQIDDNDLFARKKIRFINAFQKFDYANFGAYFFYGTELYVITESKQYQKLDVKDRFRNTIFYSFIRPGSNVTKGLYAGHDTGFRDDSGERIYTGDFIRSKGSSTAERDPRTYYLKDRNVINEHQFLYEVFGVVSSCFGEDYLVVLDNHGAFLCHATELEILGNIFYDLIPNERVDIRGKAFGIAQSDYFPNGFWCIQTRDTVKDYLSKISTPSFLIKDSWWKRNFNKLFLHGK